jgi:signal transduction histidine kinase
MSIHTRIAGGKDSCMTAPEADSPDARAAALARRDHALRSPLAIIRGRTQLLQRAILRDTGLTQQQTTRLLRDLAAIDVAVVDPVAVITALDQEPSAAAP